MGVFSIYFDVVVGMMVLFIRWENSITLFMWYYVVLFVKKVILVVFY